MKPATTQRVIGALLRMISCFGIPRSITADNGPQFRATEFSKFCNSYGIHLNLSTPYWPEQNGAVERQMRNIGKRLKISAIQDTDWKTDLYEYITLYHSTPQETTGLSPGQMMFGREIRNRIPSIHQPPKLRLEAAKDKDMMIKEYHQRHANQDRHAKEHKLKRGDVVLMRDLNPGAMQPNFRQDEFEVTQVDKGAITVKSMDTEKVYLRNSSHLKKLKDSETVLNDTTEQYCFEGPVETESRDGDTYAGASGESTEQVDAATNVVTDKRELRAKRASKLPNKFQDYVMVVNE